MARNGEKTSKFGQCEIKGKWKMKKYKILLEIVLREVELTRKQIEEIIVKNNLDEHLARPLRFYYKKSKKDGTDA